MSIVRDATAVHWASLVTVFGSEYITIISTVVDGDGVFDPATGTNITEEQSAATYRAVCYNDTQNQNTINVFDEVDYILNVRTVNRATANPIRLRDNVIIAGIKYEIIDVQTFVGSDLIRVKGKKKI